MERNILGVVLVFIFASGVISAQEQSPAGWELLRKRIQQNQPVEDLLKPSRNRDSSPGKSAWQEQIKKIASQIGVDPLLALAVIEEETGLSSAPAPGEDKRTEGVQDETERSSPDLEKEAMTTLSASNIASALKLLKQLLARFELEEALSIYYGGENYRDSDPSVRKKVEQFVEAVQTRLRRYAGS